MATIAVPASVPSQPVLTPDAAPGRLVYLDNLKTVLVAAVIMAHAAITYGVLGDWTYMEQSRRSLLTTILSLAAITGWLFAIGLFFLVAGLLAPASLARKGPWLFARDRVVRLGAPLAIFVLVVMPLLRYAVHRITQPAAETSPLAFWGLQEWPKNTGPLWFAAFLLGFSLVYGLVRWRRAGRRSDGEALSAGKLLALGVAIAGGSAVLRLLWPFDPREALNLHVGLWVQYPLMFWFGTRCAEEGWLASLPDRLWHVCGLVAAAGLLAVPPLVIVSGKLQGEVGTRQIAWPWPDLAMAGIEGILAVSASLWLLEWFRRHATSQGSLWRALARNAYAAYALQAPILVGLGLAMRPLTIAPEAKFLLLATAALILSFGVARVGLGRFRVLARVL